MAKTALVAIGGNSIIPDPSRSDIPHQWEAIREACRHLADLHQAGWRLVITHGNGPQVGFILRRNELATAEVSPIPLDLIVADTQGGIGYMLQQALHNELYSRGLRRSVVALITQTLVDGDDPAFANPTKPIGAFLSEEQAQIFANQGWTVVEDAGRGWRRVLASPQPRAVIETDAIRTLLDADQIVIAAGGGGIPVVQNASGELRELKGVYGVVDKDRTSALLATELKADLFLISTGVEMVALHFNTPQQQNLHEITVGELQRYAAAGHFAAGSMGPKVEAVIEFVQTTGKPALITNPPNLTRALQHETGTWITPQ
ncbi:MAG TPA: carbamate kinase [Caldilineaceae bacterium]|nr:carbamate kinase [Caldilineaceae bacterium]